ncbi:hypothetical protein [Gimesia panareensis]|uniref:hypothetical protein n=1 Tax=Gimesia panareensis TaxID=2527978 RepID=UPI00118A2B43|nr:hypothetical protein [Gimesia panareensis]QDU49239.1 hypothetical protein Pan110_15580 [Gimesia panareensis]
MKTTTFKTGIHTIALMLLSFSACALTGCEKKEKVLDVETPAGELEINRDKDSGSVDVKVKKNEDQ